MKRMVQVLKITDVISSVDDHAKLNRRVNVPTTIAMSKMEYVPDGSKFMNYEIKDYPGVNQLTVDGINDSQFNFYPKYASLEFRHNDIWNNDTSLKPRDKVYGQNIVPLAVVRRDDDIFLLIFTSSKTDFNKIKQTLRIDGMHGDVDPISSDLFTWLFYQFQMNEKMISDYMKIQQITGFLSTIGQDADSDSVSAKSGSVDTLSATKLEIALNHTLRSMELSIGLEEVNAKFTFDEKSFLLIDTAVTTLDNAFSKNYTGYIKEHSLMAQAVYIFAILLPLFEMEFGDDEVAFSGHVKTYRESLAKELVNKLLDAHPKLRENINQI